MLYTWRAFERFDTDHCLDSLTPGTWVTVGRNGTVMYGKVRSRRICDERNPDAAVVVSVCGHTVVLWLDQIKEIVDDSSMVTFLEVKYG